MNEVFCSLYAYENKKKKAYQPLKVDFGPTNGVAHELSPSPRLRLHRAKIEEHKIQIQILSSIPSRPRLVFEKLPDLLRRGCIGTCGRPGLSTSPRISPTYA
jgi:hypothetical protein